MATLRVRRATLLAAIMAVPTACGGAPPPEAPAPGDANDAREVLRAAEADHALLRLTTMRGDTLIGRVTVRGSEVRMTGTSRRLDVAELRSIARGSALEAESGTAFRVAAPVLLLLLVLPVAAFAAGYGDGRLALALLLGAVTAGGILGAAVADVDDPELGAVEWTIVWEAV